MTESVTRRHSAGPRPAMRRRSGAVAAAGLILALSHFPHVPRAAAQDNEAAAAFRFRSGVELINVSVTVTDRRGRFVTTLDQDDFLVYDDGEPQRITHFSRERVPVSLGIVLDTSGSMEGERMAAARAALDRFLFDLLGPDDEIFLYRFSYQPRLVHDWTTDPARVSRSLGGIRPTGGTALYDAVADAVRMAETGRHRKKAVVIISDGNDTNSDIDDRSLQRLIRRTEVLVYAVGIDGPVSVFGGNPVPRQPIPPARPPRIPFPVPGGNRAPLPPIPGGPFPGQGIGRGERVNARALRDITDDSGGRTEIINEPNDLDPATAGIADELSRQYYLGYPAPGHADGVWHDIEVHVRSERSEGYNVRARRGYIAAP